MRLADLISLLSRIDDEEPKQEEVKEEEPKKEEPREERKLDEKDILIQMLKEQIATKDEIINQNTVQIKELKEQATIDNPQVEQEYTLTEIIERGEF